MFKLRGDGAGDGASNGAGRGASDGAGDGASRGASDVKAEKSNLFPENEASNHFNE
jgi:hypothetical protein